MDMESIDRRLDELERQNAALKAENNAIRSKLIELEDRGAPRKSIAPARVPEPAVTISHPVTQSAFVMPSDADLDKLAAIVTKVYPQFGDLSGQAFHGDQEERQADWRRQYKLAFLALGTFKRTEQPDRKKYLSYWVGAVEAHLRSIGKSTDLRGGPFMCAVLAHGDIPFSGIPPTQPGGIGKVLEIGIAEHVGRSATDQWRQVLATRQILPEGQTVRVMVPRKPQEFNIVKSYVPSMGE